MDLFEYLKENFQRFSLYSALSVIEHIYSCSIDKIKTLKFRSGISLHNSSEITHMTMEADNLVITTNKPCLFDYLPKFYLDQFLDLDTASQDRLNQCLDLFTREMVYLGFKVNKLNYLPQYSINLIEKILSNFGLFYQNEKKTLFLHYYRTPFILKQLIEYLFENMVICHVETHKFRSLHLGPASNILGNNWLGIKTKICDLSILQIECLNREVFHYIKDHGLGNILELFPPVEVQTYLRALKVEAVLGKVRLGYGVALIIDHHYQ